MMGSVEKGWEVEEVRGVQEVRGRKKEVWEGRGNEGRGSTKVRVSRVRKFGKEREGWRGVV